MIEPMLCQSATLTEAKEFAKKGWLIEHKYDGVRGVIKDGRLFDRRKKEITHLFPEFEGLKDVIGTFDGEIVAQTGEFNDVAGRMHMKDKFLIKMSAKSNPAQFVAFDMPDERKTLDVRRMEMEGKVLPKWLHIAPQYSGENFIDLWNSVLAERREGLVMKRPEAKYEFGKRSHNWLKVKAFVEEIAEFVKYEEHPKGITIETKEGRRVVVNGHQANDVRDEFKKTGKIQAEIQYLPQRDSDAWRFPSFRGLK